MAWEEFQELVRIDKKSLTKYVASEKILQLLKKAKEKAKLRKQPSLWPTLYWKKCWNGKWVDFTHGLWSSLSVKKQIEYAKAYQKWYAFKKGKLVEQVFSLGQEKCVMTLIPPGRFWMGAPSKEPGRFSQEGKRHKVLITKAFWMGKYEITQRQWVKVAKNTPWRGRENARDDPKDAANYISWYQIYKQFLPKVDFSFNIPTEAQWEYAARAGTTTRFYWGNDFDYKQISNYAWYRKNALDVGDKHVHNIGRKKPNSWGLYDISGNVWEWCQDHCDYDWKKYVLVTNTYVSDVENPVSIKGPMRIFRGGSWNSEAWYSRSAYRSWRIPGDESFYLGFRLIKNLK